jgi:CD109 antigen
MAIVAYALEKAASARRSEAHDKLVQMAIEDENGLHWGESGVLSDPAEKTQAPGLGLSMPVNREKTTAIEATAYATLALTRHGDALNASKAAKWLVSRRNAYGGYGSTQDTVVTLQSLTEQAMGARADVDLNVTLKSGDSQQKIRITKENYDVLQIAEITPGNKVEVSALGKGEVIGQVVSRYHVPAAVKAEDQVLKVSVDYDTTEVAVNDLVNVLVKVSFSPPEPVEAGMVVVDVSVPTGFAPVTETLAEAVKKNPLIKRYDVAGRKVIFYVENMKPGEQIAFAFQVKAMYPVRAKGVTSTAYSYYQPEMRGESLSRDVVVR